MKFQNFVIVSFRITINYHHNDTYIVVGIAEVLEFLLAFPEVLVTFIVSLLFVYLSHMDFNLVTA